MSVCLNEETLQAYFDDELAPDAAAAVRTHLTGCAACADCARELELALILIDNAFDDELPGSVPTVNLRSRVEESVFAAAPSVLTSQSAGLFSWRHLLNSLTARLQAAYLFPRRFWLEFAIVLVAIVLAGGLAIRYWRSATSEPKKDLVQQGVTNPTERTPSNESEAKDQRPVQPSQEKRKEPKRVRFADQLAHRATPEPTPPKPTPIEMVERIEPAEGVSTVRRAKSFGNATLRNPETSEHLRQTQMLLRSVRNTPVEKGAADFDLAYEKRLSRELLSKNRLLRRSAENNEDSQTEELLSQIEPLLLDIAHLSDKPSQDEVRSVKGLIREQKIIAMLQIYSAKADF
ncbi:MAG TPA: zf-HC2 domain-containing protein [Blastocatellia bacterium]|nr:zf-HC2 domain-containing protein [Blastocatellia bacterium]